MSGLAAEEGPRRTRFWLPKIGISSDHLTAPSAGYTRPQLSVLSLSVTRALLSERPVMAASGGRMITNRFVGGCGLHGGLCPILGADWERRFAVSCGQMRPGAVIVAIPEPLTC